MHMCQHRSSHTYLMYQFNVMDCAGIHFKKSPRGGGGGGGKSTSEDILGGTRTVGSIQC